MCTQILQGLKLSTQKTLSCIYLQEVQQTKPNQTETEQSVCKPTVSRKNKLISFCMLLAQFFVHISISLNHISDRRTVSEDKSRFCMLYP